MGLVLHAHSLVVDVALLAGFAAGLLGLCLLLQQPVLWGALFGTGVGIAFLAKGLLGPGCLGLSALVLTLLFEPWRSRRVLKAMGVATLAALPWLIVWPVALYERAPVLLADWFWQENVGRFLGSAHRGAEPESWYYVVTTTRERS